MRHKKRKKRKSPDPHVVDQEVAADDDTYRVDLTITVTQAHNLKKLPSPLSAAAAAKGSSAKVGSFVKYTRFPGLPEAGTEMVSQAVYDGVYHLTTTFTHVAVTEELLNALVAEPLEFEVVETLKKHKSPVGAARLDLEPLLRGETSLATVLPLALASAPSGDLTPHKGSRAALLADSPTFTIGGYDDDENAYDDGGSPGMRGGDADDPEVDNILGGRPGLSVSVAVSAPLVAPGEWEAARVAQVAAPGVYALPPGCMLPSPDVYRYALAVTLPSGERIPQLVMLPDCEVVVPASDNGSVDGSDAPSFESLDSTGRVLSKASLPGVLLPEEQAAVDEAARYKHAEHAEPYIDFSVLSQRIFLVPAAASKLLALAKHNIPLKLELRRTLAPVHASAGVVDPNEARYAAEAFLSLAPLLEPGTTRLLARVPLERPQEPSEEEAATAAAAAAAEAAPSSKSARHTRGERGSRAKGSKKREREAKNALELVAEDSTAPWPWTASGGYVKIELQLSAPLVPRPPTPKPVYSVRDFVPARPAPALPARPLLTAPEEFKAEIEAATDALVETYRKLYGEQLLNGEFSNAPEAVEERKARFIYELNSNGAYFGLKEQLKAPVVRIVREKFQRTSPFASKAETQTFLNDLYMYLIDRMHEALNGVFSSVHEIPIPTTVEDTSTLKRYAAEAEINGAYELAARHYQERIARASQNVEFWYDYGVFCLRVNDTYKADECFREAISLDDKHIPSLKVYGMLCATLDKFAEARTMVEAAAAEAGNDPVVLGMFALVVALDDGDKGEEMWAAAEAAYTAAATAPEPAAAAAAATADDEFDERSEPESELGSAGSAIDETPQSTLAITIARELLGVHLPAMAERAIAREVLDAGMRAASPDAAAAGELGDAGESELDGEPSSAAVTPRAGPGSAAGGDDDGEAPEVLPESVDVLLCRAEQFMQEAAYEDASEALTRLFLMANELDSERGMRLHALWGHLKLVLQDFEAAESAYEKSLALTQDDAAEATDSEAAVRELLAVYLRLGSLYVTKAKFSDAKYVYLKACQLSPSAFTWLGVGVSCYRLGELDQAEDALSEANILNNFDADVWGYLTLVCLKTERVTEGDQAFMQALKLDLANGALLTEIGEAYFEVGRYADAEQCLRRSIELEEAPHAHRILAQVLNAQGQKEGAVAEYMMVLASSFDEEDVKASRAGLVDILMRLGRVEQAQFYLDEIEREHAEAAAVKEAEVEAAAREKRLLQSEFE
ncbi:tetratricopeptide repeat domain 18 [Thecamonas trahens ATCC 50062]|uniref:Tetratricopeptide repeat domain 18 n=1 Tax=Thecamonas trahens ATCC 50062 TaxID=461836 RepID=A0A0L0DJL9_THETB|nr:tetratricopeptide repeat domain 18 [Thecamonas trahens ATCC 50062]KNC51493.1 tetratricopeptide repeat domain 18 [Thecamonas trahens ATCC 50062]|eukprot:XP_013756151.1 tetratricopeptide repeat domain 18 [Thecamonas trahens ATCC 50062]